MIGLGSNRLSVCRRGGMRVTQAGRGGMEWLAGGRVPDWITPYSAQATAALKAQFPTQWPTIRDYGFAHPEIVPWVNQYPIGWGNIIVGYQLCEYIQATGTQYIYFPFTYQAAIDHFRIKFSIDQSSLAWLLGAWTNSSGNNGLNIDNYNGWRFELGAGNVNDFKLTDWNPQINTIYDIEWEDGKLRMDGKEPLSVSAGTPTNNNISLFALHNPSKYGSYPGKCGILEIGAGTAATYSYACYRKSDGVRGMYDVANNAFRTNAGSGTFLKGSDIYYPGQSPS